MSDKKNNERKKSKNNDKNNNRSSESFHSAREQLSPDEEQINEPRSSYYLSPAENFNDSDSDADVEADISSKSKQQFRSSMSLHHLQTVKSSTQEESNGLPPRPSTKELATKPSEATLIALPVLSQLNAEPLKDPTTGKEVSASSSKLAAPTLNENPKIVRISIDEALPSTDAPRRHSKRTLKPDDSFRTNLETGNAFVYMVLPPDGGYGWVITFVSFLVQIITDGIVFSVGLILPSMAVDFKVEMSQAILISALQISFYYLSGPITSAIINKYGFRVVAIIGASGGAICLLAASFSPNLEMMLFFYSFLGGPCMAMTWVASQLIIGYYFEKYRSIANGLSCSGSGAGFIIFVQMNTYLVPKVGWRNNTRIHAGLLIVALLLSLTYAEVPPSKIGIIREQDPTNEVSDEDEEQEVHSFNYADPTSVEPEDRAVEFITLEKLPVKDLVAYQRRNSTPYQRCMNKCLGCNCCRRPPEEEEEDIGAKRFVIKKELIERQDLYYTGPAEYTEHDRAAKREIIDGQDVELIETDRPVHSINYSMSQFAARKSKTGEEIAEKKGCCYRFKSGRWIPKKTKKTLGILFNFSLFRIMEFQVLFASAFLFALAYNIPFLFSKARLDLPEEQMSYIPIFIGITNFSFRIICGFIAFKFKKSVVYLCGGTIVLGGLACITSAFYGNDNFWFQIAYASVFGMAPAFFSTLRAIIYVQYLGLENLTNAFCMVSMGMGLAVFCGTMIGGFLNKATNDYAAAFTFSGFNIVASGILKLLLPYFSRQKQTARKVKFQV